MSREFHYVRSNFMHDILEMAESDREITGEPVADAIRDLFLALAPIEHEVASEQAGDAGHVNVVLACHAHSEKLNSAMTALRKAVMNNANLVAKLVAEKKLA